ncbi:hypothetical protein ColLi_13409 [Colletotrichum liriopes]|uniref:Uncharacterized protein n=1 Tax=Colletotrichum liriopes TaxID=708192 RepID=A0AA37H051_9PEZI|nr:hypothetical protein ColLi_12893 [Colletotrichum liriopes]GJC90571.1 hypothetical protein ColLi_13409 [Colletotrichum liriopes]
MKETGMNNKADVQQSSTGRYKAAFCAIGLPKDNLAVGEIRMIPKSGDSPSSSFCFGSPLMSEAYGEAAIDTVGLNGGDGTKATAYSPTPLNVANRKLRIGKMSSYKGINTPLDDSPALIINVHVLVNRGATKDVFLPGPFLLLRSYPGPFPRYGPGLSKGKQADIWNPNH